MLCKMMLSGANVLLLDEPTNHLDLESIASLNDGLIKYPETILFTSHDHQFVETVADRIIDVTPGHFFDEAITFDEYVEKHRSKMIKNNDKSKPYSHPRWNDKQLPVVTGYKELSKEEKERVDRDFKEYCENHGIEIVEDL